jgi:5-methylthioribose kinase
VTAGTEPLYLDGDNRVETERYLTARRLVGATDLPIAIERAGAGNMNLTLRVTPKSGASFILKQGRPWVEKYKHIPAPADRTRVEAAFYSLVQVDEVVARRMPSVIDFDADNRVLVLEDIRGRDCTSIYAGEGMSMAAIGALLDWLAHLAQVAVPADRRAELSNRAMRVLNHEHIFTFPLRDGNGLDLDAITPGLQDAAAELTQDRAYCDAVAALGNRYRADGAALVHGDYFPGSWLQSAEDVRVIDPEFCFLGDPEFDLGVMSAHLTIAGCDGQVFDMISAAANGRRLDPALVAGYAGVEIMRRLIGVAQLPLTFAIGRKRALLERSRRLVVDPDRGIA